jgi:hypothetical protein
VTVRRQYENACRQFWRNTISVFNLGVPGCLVPWRHPRAVQLRNMCMLWRIDICADLCDYSVAQEDVGAIDDLGATMVASPESHVFQQDGRCSFNKATRRGARCPSTGLWSGRELERAASRAVSLAVGQRQSAVVSGV